MKAFKVEMIIVDHEGYGKQELINNIMNMKYYNPDITKIECGDIGVWADNHPLNYRYTPYEDKLKYFEDQSGNPFKDEGNPFH